MRSLPPSDQSSHHISLPHETVTPVIPTAQGNHVHWGHCSQATLWLPLHVSLGLRCPQKVGDYTEQQLPAESQVGTQRKMCLRATLLLLISFWKGDVAEHLGQGQRGSLLSP